MSSSFIRQNASTQELMQTQLQWQDIPGS